MSKILINVMFNENKGSYAVQEKNIVHEIINLFKADNGKNYIYITRDGKITKAADQELDAILLVRAYCKGVVQVVALAKNVRYIDGEREDSSSIEYGGRTLKDIFYCNTGNNNFYVTFEAKKVLVPKKLLLIASSEDETKEFPEFVDVTIIRKRIRNQSMRLYISDDEYEEQAKKEAF